MCYSKEVQLATGSTIVSFGLIYYILFFIKYRNLQKWIISFLNYVILAFILIGGHQLFEFLSIITKNQIIYKIGLILSISSMYFFLQSLEVLLNRDIKSKVALWIIGAVTIHAFSIKMSFEESRFFLNHNSAFVWASAWMLLFIYFHICAIKGYQLLKNDLSKKTIIIYLLATSDISFILSIIYTLWGYSKFSVNVCTASPSIWCTFYVIQIFALPFFLLLIPKTVKARGKRTIQTPKETLLYFIISIIIIVLLILTLPFFKCLNIKLIFP